MTTRDEKIAEARIDYERSLKKVQDRNSVILHNLSKLADEAIAQAGNAFQTVCDTAVDDE